MGKKRIKEVGLEEELKEVSEIKKQKKRGAKFGLAKGKVFIQSTYNNTIVTITDLGGNVVAWSSSGLLGFKGAKKATPYVAGLVVKDVLDKIKDSGLRQIEIFVKGIGSGREAAVRALANEGLDIILIKDVTPIPHNGCRPRKIRRV